MALLKPIFLTQNQITYVPAELWAELNAVKWYALWNQHTQSYYAARAIQHPNIKTRRTMERLHRRIMGCVPDDGKIVDHINGDTLLNSLANLRIATASGNSFNHRKQANNTSGHPGICWNKAKKKWLVRVGANGSPGSYIGYAATIEDAVVMRNNAIKARDLEDWIRDI
jgi:hypothetical protein